MADSSRLVLLARTREGYGNISRLFTLANTADRRKPRLDPRHLPQHTAGVTLLTGGRDGPLSRLMLEGRTPKHGGSCTTTWSGSAQIRYTWSCSITSYRATLGATGNWPHWLPRPARRWQPPTTFIITPRNATGCNMRWWRPAMTPPLTKPCASYTPTSTYA